MATTTTTTTASAPTFPLVYPPAFSLIHPHLYRASTPTNSTLSSLQHLHLKSILSLGPDIPSKALLTWCSSRHINFVHLGALHPPSFSSPLPVPPELIKESLEFLLLKENAPTLLIDPSGVYETGMVGGVLRRLEGWSLSAVISEYNSLAGSKGRSGNEQFIELFDTDLISIPPKHLRVPWFVDPLEFEEGSGADGGGGRGQADEGKEGLVEEPESV